jgi:adenosylcobinamide-GDP ribazoletransferase
MMSIDLPPAFITALRTLTILPVSGRDASVPADALSWFPAAGAVVGLALWFVQAILGAFFPGVPPAIAAVAVLLAGVLLTRGLHLDGLADWADASWGGWTPARRLEIMKDPSLGTFGTLALILVLLAKWSAICVLIEADAPVWVILACILSRTVQADLAVCFPYARPEGGTGAAFVNQATGIHRRNAFLAAFLFALVLGVFTLRPFVLGVVAIAAGRVFGHSCSKAFGGITGDILGAGNEIAETLVLILAAALVS